MRWMRFFLSLPFMLALIVVLFYIKGNVAQLMKRDRELDKQIKRTSESLVTLKADWAYCNDPTYIEKLATQYLNMGPLKHKQVHGK